MKRIVCLMALAVFFAANLLVVGAVLAGGPPSQKLDKLPASYEAEQELKKGIDVRVRKITLTIDKDGVAELVVPKVNFGEWVVWEKKMVLRLEVEEDRLEVKEIKNSTNSEGLGKFKSFEIIGRGEFLKVNSWKGGTSKQSLEYGEVLLKRM